MKFTQEEQNKMNADGIKANTELITTIKHAMNSIRCGFVICDTCPMKLKTQAHVCAFVEMEKILNDLVNV